ncbi:hypothetical protein TorRG33x02_205730 [Trema orientale]|uniref:Uncharacterized protein n=1 Tax=Trema orientale TaxID=63057 RepID=A0A2P5EDJ8_TREOI|nr:hypothetical protein TorRG33x02_205730 [Trema orientale]
MYKKVIAVQKSNYFKQKKFQSPSQKNKAYPDNHFERKRNRKLQWRRSKQNVAEISKGYSLKGSTMESVRETGERGIMGIVKCSPFVYLKKTDEDEDEDEDDEEEAVELLFKWIKDSGCK